MNFTSAFQDEMKNNGLETGSGALTHKLAKEHRIDDVSMDEPAEDTYNNNLTSLMSNMRLFNDMINNFQPIKNTSANSLTCTEDGKVYKIGEKFNKGCNETCQCVRGGEINCSTICKTPYLVKGRNKDPYCNEVPVDGNSCCVILVCQTKRDSGHGKNCFSLRVYGRLFG